MKIKGRLLRVIRGWKGKASSALLLINRNLNVIKGGKGLNSCKSLCFINIDILLTLDLPIMLPYKNPQLNNPFSTLMNPLTLRRGY